MEGTPDALASPEYAWFDASSEELISCGAVAAFHQSESVRTDSEFISSESSSATEPEIVPNIEPVVTLPISSESSSSIEPEIVPIEPVIALPISPESSSSIEPEIVRIEPVVAFPSSPESSSSSSSSSSIEPEIVPIEPVIALPISPESSSIEPEIVRIEPVVAFPSSPESSSSSSSIEPVIALLISPESSSSIEPEIVRIEPVVAFPSFPESSSSSSSSSSRESETVRTDWHTALERRNCKMLLSLLRQAPIDTLWSDPYDRTVLHVAVIQGCLQLVNEVLHLYVTFPNLKPSRDSLLHAKDKSLCGADALQLATVVGNQNILKTIKHALTANPGLPTDIDSEEEFPDAKMNEELYCLIKQKFLEQDAGTRSRLNTNFKDDVDYNFVQNRHELLFLHVACKHSELSDFLWAVLRETTERGNHLLQALSELKDAQGRTLLHVAVEEHGFGDAERDTTMAAIVGVLLDFLGEVPQAGRYDKRVNALDSAGRTPLHRAVANGRAGSKVIQALVDHSGTDVNARWGSENDRVTGEPTALHLAVFHNNVDAAQFLLGKEETDADLKCRLFIEASGIWYSNKCKLAKEKWTALEFATIMGHAHMVRLLLETRDKLDVDRCFHLATASGDPRCLQLLLDTAKLGAAKRRHLTKFIDEFAPLHYAVHASYPNPEQGSKINYFLSFDNYVNVYTLEKIGVKKCKARNLEDSEGSASLRYGGKKGCVNLLLQAGVDIWQRDKNGYIADPGFDAPDEARLWWYDKITKEKYRAKTKINAAGTATAVVAALIASSSFNAHFSPLTSYDSDMNYHEPTTKVLVKIFVITNCISFYVAMTSIMLAIVPSFPLAQEGLREELARSRSAVRKAIRALLLSIASFIVSFIFSSIAVVPNERSYKLLPIISAGLGGIFCIYGFVRVFSQESKFH